MATTPAQNTTLTLPTRLLILLGPPSTILLTSMYSPTAAIATPLAFIPPLFLYRQYAASNTLTPTRHAELEPLIWTGLATGTLGLASAATVQILILKGALRSIFCGNRPLAREFFKEFQRTSIDGLTTSELASRAAIAGSWQNWAFNTIFTFLAAGLVEEVVKFLPVLFAKRRYAKKSESNRRDRSYIDFAIAGTLGFGLVEALGFIYSICKLEDQSRGMIALMVVERVAGQMGHLATAALSAVRATRRDFYAGDSEGENRKRMSWRQVFGPSALYHGFSDFVALSASALDGNVGFIHPRGVKLVVSMIGVIGCIWGAAGWQMWREWEGLDELDRQTAGEKVMESKKSE
ncbi:hypothetical protein DL98DRAFT_462956 [Cadophora sp. DSE1049]|nr:hypothetical protein DL98DRAFT_462956 [Cadophora sp. DSE1049]